MSPRKTISPKVLPPLNDLLFKSENNDVQITTLEYDPEPCVDTWDASCHIVDPEPCVDTWDASCHIVDPEPCVDTWNGSCLDSKYGKDDDPPLLNWLFDLVSST